MYVCTYSSTSPSNYFIFSLSSNSSLPPPHVTDFVPSCKTTHMSLNTGMGEDKGSWYLVACALLPFNLPPQPLNFFFHLKGISIFLWHRRACSLWASCSQWVSHGAGSSRGLSPSLVHLLPVDKNIFRQALMWQKLPFCLQVVAHGASTSVDYHYHMQWKHNFLKARNLSHNEP